MLWRRAATLTSPAPSGSVDDFSSRASLTRRPRLDTLQTPAARVAQHSDIAARRPSEATSAPPIRVGPCARASTPSREGANLGAVPRRCSTDLERAAEPKPAGAEGVVSRGEEPRTLRPKSVPSTKTGRRAGQQHFNVPEPEPVAMRESPVRPEACGDPVWQHRTPTVKAGRTCQAPIEAKVRDACREKTSDPSSCAGSPRLTRDSAR